ncbi:MAG TPA: hypothetical protein DCM45_02965 [Clostridiales bacterium]|nr:hypothetical protein [Clostridiales bacterium]
MARLAIIQLDRYDQDLLKAGFKTAFAELGLQSGFQPGEKILIKPNMLSGIGADHAVTAHPSVFNALASCLRDFEVELSFGDSPSLDTPDKAAAACGIYDEAKALGIPLSDFVSVVDTPMPNGKVMRQIPLARGVAESNGLVSLGKLKTHPLTGMTGAIKNQFGVIPGQRKAAFHVTYPRPEDFCQMLVDINVFLKPRLYVIDAIVAMEGNGPRNGQPRKVGAVLVSREPATLDAAGALLMGMNPSDITTCRLAAQAGLGTCQLADAEAVLIRPNLTGDQASGEICRGTAEQLLTSLSVKDFVRGRMARGILSRTISLSAPLYKKHVMQRPAAETNLCNRCGICATACPADPPAISYKDDDGVPAFDYERCIRCYCCQETCPAGAIKVKVTPVGRIFGV